MSGRVSQLDIPFDIALIWFEDDTAPATANICNTPPKRNDKITIVGYGYNTTSGGGKVKRQGVNNISNIQAEGVLSLQASSPSLTIVA